MYMLGPFIGPVVDFQNQWLNFKKKKKKKRKKKKSNFQNDRKISQPIKIKRFIVILVKCIKKITSKVECSEKDFSRHFFFSFPKL